MKIAWLAILVCGLVLAVALGSSRSAARVGHRTVLVVVLYFCLISVALIGYTLWASRRRLSKNDPFPWKDTLVTVFLAVVLAAVLAVISGLVKRHGNPDMTTTTIKAGRRVLRSGKGASLAYYQWPLVGLAAVVAGAVVLLLVRRLWAERVGGARGRLGHRARALPAEESGPDAQVLAALEDSLEEIQRETDPRRAVIRAYMKMGQILADRGLGRLDHEAPVEYLNRALVGIRLSRAAAERLTDLFVRARFSTHAVDPQLKNDAIAALTAVRDELQAAQQ